MSEAATETTGKIVWFELPAQDTSRARAFYGQLFGWHFESFGGEDYYMTPEGGGGIYSASDQNALLAYFGVDDVEASAVRVRELGGEAREKQEIPGLGFYALCTDTEGNAFGLYQAATAG